MYSTLRHIDESAIETIKENVIVIHKNDKEMIRNVDMREIVEKNKVDYYVEIKDYDKIIESSALKEELSLIKGLRAVFEETNTSMLRENVVIESDDLVETSNREMLNRNLVLNLKRRGLSFTQKDNIYFENKIDLSYNEIKGYYINLTLSFNYNQSFKAIANRLKQAIASKKQSFTTFNAMLMLSDNKRNYLINIPDLSYNNERFSKDIYKLFIPKTTLVIAEVIQIAIKESNTWHECPYYVETPKNENVINLQNFY
jgi:hypothetical protein